MGSDAELVIWDAERAVTVTHGMLHDNMNYTPYEGMELTGWPETVINQGRIIVKDNELKADPGSGTFLDRKPGHSAAIPVGTLQTELDPNQNLGAEIL